MPAEFGLTLAGSKVKGNELPRDGSRGLCQNLLHSSTFQLHYVVNIKNWTNTNTTGS